jgi:hypothetical protein
LAGVPIGFGAGGLTVSVVKRAMRTLGLAGLLLLPQSGCSRDIFDVDVEFETQRYAFDFGAEGGEIPTLACEDPNDACESIAAELEGGAPIRAVRAGCSPAAGQCFLEADAELAVSLSVLTQSDYNSKVQRRAIALVRRIEVAYAVPINTLTFDIPQIDVFVGPDGAQQVSDEGVVLADSVRPLPAGTASAAPAQSLRLDEGSAAFSVMADAILKQRPFVLVLAMSPRLVGGQAVPAGQLSVEVRPRVRLGVPD